MSKLLIKGGKLVFADGVREGDILADGGKIIKIGQGLEDAGAEVVDARGLHVLDENEVCRMLVLDPLRTVSQALDAQDEDNPAKKRENAE